VIIVDDRLASAVLSGRRHLVPGDGPVATTWGFHYRLVRALTDGRVEGTLIRAAADVAPAIAASPPPAVLDILDPRLATHATAQLSIDHRLNLLAAELAAAAQVHRAEIVLAAGNVGRSWPDLFAELGIPLTVV